MVVQILIILWVSSEILLGLSRRAGSDQDRVSDKGSERLLWLAITVAVFLGIALREQTWARIQITQPALEGLAIFFLVGGVAFRWWAILSLGDFFTTNVAVRSEHRVVTAGPYRWIRHPGYTGMLVAFLGCGWYMGSWLSLVILMVPITVAILYRVRVEEITLLEGLGEEYGEYRARTKALLPWIY